MAQDITSKQVGFATRYDAEIVNLLRCADRLGELHAEMVANAYPTGAQPTSSNITDEILQSNGFAFLTALQFNQADGAVVSVLATIASNRGYLEAARP